MKIILDTMPLIGYFKGEAGYERVRDLIRRIEEGDIDGFISVIHACSDKRLTFQLLIPFV